MEDFDDKLIGIVSAFLIPATAKNYGDGYDFDDVKNDILDMSFTTANSIAFFCAIKQENLTSVPYLI